MAEHAPWWALAVRMNLAVHVDDTIHPLSNKFATGMKIMVMGESQLKPFFHERGLLWLLLTEVS